MTIRESLILKSMLWPGQRFVGRFNAVGKNSEMNVDPINGAGL